MPSVSDVFIRVHTLAELSGLNRSQTTLERFGAAATRIGTSMAIGVSLPLAAVGGAALKLGLDFDNALTKIVTLVGISREQVNEWRDDVLALSRDVAIGPAELANALFFVTSSGVKASEAMEVLRASATASAIGLADTEQVARVVSTALNVYAGTNLTAADASAILVATVREGTAEADELQNAIGRVIPVAAQLGIGFDQVGASLAVMTRGGLSGEEAATALRAALLNILAPTSEAGDVLEELGLNASELRAMLADPSQGLLAVFRLLSEETGGNVETMDKLFGNVRGLVGVFNILRQEGASVDEVFRELAETTGSDLGPALAEMARSPGFQLRQALNNLGSTLTDFGDTLAPIIAGQLVPAMDKLSTTLQALVDNFERLPRPAQQAGLDIGVVAIAAGPAIIALGLLVNVVASTARGLATLASAVKKLGTFAGLRAGLGALTAAAILFVDVQLARAIISLHKPVDDMSLKAAEGARSTEGFARGILSVTQKAIAFIRPGDGLAKSFGLLDAAISNLDKRSADLKDRIDLLKLGVDPLVAATDSAKVAMGRFRIAQDDLDKQLADGTITVSAYRAEQQRLIAILLNDIQQHQILLDSVGNVKAAMIGLATSGAMTAPFVQAILAAQSATDVIRGVTGGLLELMTVATTVGRLAAQAAAFRVSTFLGPLDADVLEERLNQIRRFLLEIQPPTTGGGAGDGLEDVAAGIEAVALSLDEMPAVAAEELVNVLRFLEAADFTSLGDQLRFVQAVTEANARAAEEAAEAFRGLRDAGLSAAQQLASLAGIDADLFQQTLGLRDLTAEFLRAIAFLAAVTGHTVEEIVAMIQAQQRLEGAEEAAAEAARLEADELERLAAILAAATAATTDLAAIFGMTQEQLDVLAARFPELDAVIETTDERINRLVNDLFAAGVPMATIIQFLADMARRADEATDGIDNLGDVLDDLQGLLSISDEAMETLIARFPALGDALHEIEEGAIRAFLDRLVEILRALGLTAEEIHEIIVALGAARDTADDTADAMDTVAQSVEGVADSVERMADRINIAIGEVLGRQPRAIQEAIADIRADLERELKRIADALAAGPSDAFRQAWGDAADEAFAILAGFAHRVAQFFAGQKLFDLIRPFTAAAVSDLLAETGLPFVPPGTSFPVLPSLPQPEPFLPPRRPIGPVPPPGVREGPVTVNLFAQNVTLQGDPEQAIRAFGLSLV